MTDSTKSNNNIEHKNQVNLVAVRDFLHVIVDRGVSIYHRGVSVYERGMSV